MTDEELIEEVAANVLRRIGRFGLRAPWTGLALPPAVHPSQEQFAISEAAENVRELIDYFEAQQQCTIEPGKPCDHCVQCRSLGF